MRGRQTEEGRGKEKKKLCEFLVCARKRLEGGQKKTEAERLYVHKSRSD